MVSFTTFRGSESGTIKKSSTEEPSALTGDQVLLKVTASGLCGTDEHYRNVDMVLGHEGVGIIEKIGPAVKYMKVGDRVGWGYSQDCCGHCEQCLKGAETYCPERALYGMTNFDQGSFAHKAVMREAFLFKIPEKLSDEAAAPLMCGGATVFNALHAYNAQPTETVGIVGVGGLGHLAIQFASKMGMNVVVFSGTNSKKEEAMKLGATEFIATKGAKELDISRPLNRLIVTTSAQPEWSLYIPILAPGATIHPLSVADGDFKIPYMPLILKPLAIQGSAGSSRYIQRRMLDFAALHSIAPVTQEFPMTEDGIANAMDKLNHGEVRYRVVLKPQDA